ncbi:hypothetical protein SG34_020890 [Thalassomonas viridans]|uniref:Lipoprotein n=1 Tax=Thalassomonas viridans TaxID=137584 RepID=A0AAE9Z0J8_9GAMM|nr:hypothetical protein [Thalassomonas viridans]WDE03814.1 hypothetical protein SG34_020890 [Thalassomonas viridans]
MKANTKAKLQGTAVALAVAGMMGCAQTSSQGGSSSYSASNSAELGHCYGVNKCSGHNDCKTAQNACKGQASCKGHGFVAMPTKSCGDIGGTVKDDWRGKVTTADMAHCYNVNVCGGHNDCKTANNACKGQASCKGQGFVKMSAKACNDVGGKVGK